MEFLKYLFIVVPATIIGDHIVEWRRRPASEPTGWPVARLWVLAAATLLPVPVLLWGTVAREVPLAAALTALLLGMARYAVRQPRTPTERFLHSTLLWGAYWLAIGIVIEPFEGGIKKTPSTLSYYFIPGGLAAVALVGLTVILDVLRKRGPLALLVSNGQNAMLAYIGNTNLLAPAVALVNAGLVAAGHWSTGRRMEHVAHLTGSLWPGVLWAVAQTLLLALVVAWFSKRKVFLRA
jgi:predicted acyltransferase